MNVFKNCKSRMQNRNENMRVDNNHDIHCMPNDGKHDCSKDCFCEPRLDYVNPVTGVCLYIHKGPEELCQ